MDYRLKCSNPLMVDLLQTRNFSLHKMLIDGLEWCGLFVDYCDVLSDVWTLILYWVNYSFTIYPWCM